MAMLLPASFGASRRMNDSHDIRKNLRFRNAELAQEHSEDSTNEWGTNVLRELFSMQNITISYSLQHMHIYDMLNIHKIQRFLLHYSVTAWLSS